MLKEFAKPVKEFRGYVLILILMEHAQRVIKMVVECKDYVLVS